MKVIVGNNEKISKLIAEDFIKVIKEKPNAVLGLATGTSPLQVYANLVKANKEGRISFRNCRTFNLDEYVGLEGTHNQSYRYFMNENLFNHIDIDKKNTNVLLGVGDYKSFMNKYDQMIEDAGGIDIQILGIGSDGHIAFNEPGTSFDSLTHETALTEQTIKDNSRLFNDISEVPTRAITMRSMTPRTGAIPFPTKSLMHRRNFRALTTSWTRGTNTPAVWTSGSICICGQRRAFRTLADAAVTGGSGSLIPRISA